MAKKLSRLEDRLAQIREALKDTRSFALAMDGAMRNVVDYASWTKLVACIWPEEEDKEIVDEKE